MESRQLVDIAFLDHVLHEGITLRLENIVSVDPFQSEIEREANLKRAHQYSQLAASKSF